MRLRERSAIPVLSGILLTVILAMPAGVHAQAKVYTLEECIERALKTDLIPKQEILGIVIQGRACYALFPE